MLHLIPKRMWKNKRFMNGMILFPAVMAWHLVYEIVANMPTGTVDHQVLLTTVAGYTTIAGYSVAILLILAGVRQAKRTVD